MPENSTVVAQLSASPAPADRLCIRSWDDIAANITDFVSVVGLASATPQNPFPSNNNTAAQAQATADAALQIAVGLQADQKQRRSSGGLVSLATGDSSVVLSWSPAMLSTSYEVRVTLYGPLTHPAAYYGWRVISTTLTENSVSVSFDNIPAGSSFAWVVEEL